jgi:hypothetical protein
MKRLLLCVAAAAAIALPAAVYGAVGVGTGGGTPGTSENFQLVGHNALFDRGMNAALALFTRRGRTFVYIGNRSDGSDSCGDLNGSGPVAPVLPPNNQQGTCTHVHPGILIVEVTDPAHPTVVGEIPASVAAPNAAGQPVGVTSRELRVWPQKKLLIELSFRCSRTIHVCPRGDDTTFPFDYKFFDLSDPVHPVLIRRHVTRSAAGLAIKPHEFFLWVDPNDGARALLFESTPSVSVNPARPNFVVEDISDVPNGGPVRLVAEGNWNQFFPGAGNAANYDFDLSLHSMTPSFDGTRTYLAYLRGGFGVLDTSEIAHNQVPAGTVENLNNNLITPAPFPTWGTGPICAGHTVAGCAESHSAVPLPGRHYAITIDEVYGTFTVSSFGWPWGWVRTWNVANPAAPQLIGEYKIFQNTQAFQGAPPPFGDDAATERFTSYSSHNPTVLGDLIFDDWHSGGLQAINVENPASPSQAGWFSPTPLPSVSLEDPALSQGPNKVVMWSFPIIHDGLIYAVDIRNGLYILRYTGERSGEVEDIGFLEGNSNLGDAENLAGDER